MVGGNEWILRMGEEANQKQNQLPGAPASATNTESARFCVWCVLLWVAAGVVETRRNFISSFV